MGTWDEEVDRIDDATLETIARFAPDVVRCVIERQVLGPPDVEARIGLTGGHIFQGEILPHQMWEGRFAPRTPLPGVYLCGAATHPGGSVMGINGRNAAHAVLRDRGHAREASRGPVPGPRVADRRSTWRGSRSPTRGPGSSPPRPPTGATAPRGPRPARGPRARG